MDEWQIGVEPWIISDGNYSDFFVGQTSEFAIEFFSSNLDIVKTAPKNQRAL